MVWVGLADFFHFAGGFRRRVAQSQLIAALAAERISKHLRLELEPQQFIIIAILPKSIAVRADISAHDHWPLVQVVSTVKTRFLLQPDAWLPDFSDTDG